MRTERSARTVKEAARAVERLGARRMILEMVNAASLKSAEMGLSPLRMPQLQLAVFRARQRALVGPELLEMAGFRTKRRT